jgi:TRAP-type uncharacterized transport system substrate-binding protein
MVLNGEVAAQWGGGVGWPNFTKIMQAGGRLVGLSDDQIKKINAKYPFLQPLTIPAGVLPWPGGTATNRRLLQLFAGPR